MGAKSIQWVTSPKITLSEALWGNPHLQLGRPSLKANTSLAIPLFQAIALLVPVSISQDPPQSLCFSQWVLVGSSLAEEVPQVLRVPATSLALVAIAVLVFPSTLVHPLIPVVGFPRDPAPRQAQAPSVAAPAPSRVEKLSFNPVAASPALQVIHALLSPPPR